MAKSKSVERREAVQKKETAVEYVVPAPEGTGQAIKRATTFALQDGWSVDLDAKHKATPHVAGKGYMLVILTLK